MACHAQVNFTGFNFSDCNTDFVKKLDAVQIKAQKV